MKKVLASALAIVFMTAVPTTAKAVVNRERPQGTLKLDINKDEKINAVDASIVLAEYARTATSEGGTFTQTEKYISDFNDDGKIDAVDASNILSVYAQNSTEGEPYPITTFMFCAFLRVGNDLVSGDIVYSYEEAIESLEKKKEEIFASRQMYSECFIQMTSTTMTDLPKTEVKFVYREKH